MKPFDDLTPRGKARRLRKLALNALKQYALDVTRVRLVGLFTNTLFRVDTPASSYVLRVCAPGWRTETDLRSEIAWLEALNRDTKIGAPDPLPARSGDCLVEASAPGLIPCRCLVMSWIPGTLLGKRLTEKNLFKMGILFTRLHEHGARFSPPQGFTQRRMDTLYARGEEDVLFADAQRDAFTPHTWDVFRRTATAVERAFARLYADPTGLQVIHNDLWHGNIKVFRGKLYPFDFEDTVWGYPVQDIAMALQDLMMDTAPDAYEPLAHAFRQGYESRAAWPERHPKEIDIFCAGRLLWVANYVARFEREHLPEHVKRTAGILARFLETGQVNKM